MKNQCQNIKCKNPVFFKFRYCQECLCSNPACVNHKIGNYRYKKKTYHIDTCFRHTPNRCHFSSCKIILVDNQESRSCLKHQCRSDGCQNEVYNTGFLYSVNGHYCSDHRCQSYECKRPKYDGSELCQKHKCNYEGCRNESDNFAFCFGTNKRCSDHVCHSKFRCSRPIYQKYKYCDKHRCPIHNMEYLFREKVCYKCVVEHRKTQKT